MIPVVLAIAGGVGGERHHGGQAVAITRQQLGRHVEASHVRQLDVQQDEIEVIRVGHGQRLGTVPRHLHLMTQLVEQGAGDGDVQLHVLHQQDIQGGHLGLLRGRLRLDTVHLQLGGEAGAFPRIAVHIELTAHGLHQLAGDRKTYAGAGGVLLALHLIVHGEDLLLLGARNADPGVFHLEVQRQLARFIGGVGEATHRHATLVGEFDRIAHQVPQHLAQPGAVRHHELRHVAIPIEVQIEPLLLRLDARQHLQLVEEGGQVHGGRRYLEAAAIEFVQIDDVIEDVAERHRTQVDGLELLLPLGIQRRVHQHAAQADDAVERRAQLMADGGDEGGLVPARLLQFVLILLALGDVAAKAEQAEPLAEAVEEGHLAQLEVGLAAIGILQPLLIGERLVLGEDLLVGLHHLAGDVVLVDVEGGQADELRLHLAGQLLHGAVAAGELLVLVAVVDQVRRAVDEGAQQGGTLPQVQLGLLPLEHLVLQILYGLLAQGLGPVGLGYLGIEAADVLLQLAVELEVALAHVLQLAHHAGQPLAGVFQLIHDYGEEIDGPGGHQQAEEDRAHQVDYVHSAAQKQGHPHLDGDRQHYDGGRQEHAEAHQSQLGHQVDVILRPGFDLLHLVVFSPLLRKQNTSTAP